MWSNLPYDLLANIFSFLSPDSLALARSACRSWHACANAYPLSRVSSRPQNHLPWFLALPTRNHGMCCYVYNPVANKWHVLSLEFLCNPVRPIGSIGGLILLRPTNSTLLQMTICNPFTSQFSHLPKLNITRTNPAVGVVVLGGSNQSTLFPQYKVYVAGGMSEAPRGGATYESTVEMYDSEENTWRIVGSMPVEFAVRLTVWTPNESVFCNGVFYWITSARAYSVMSFDIDSNKWHELGVPMADKLEFATLVRRNGRLTLVGGTCGVEACVWELDEGENWCTIEKVPMELGLKLLGGQGSWCSTKCVAGDHGVVCLYKDLGSGMVVWRESGKKGGWEWFWVDGCCSVTVSCKKVHNNMSIKGVLIQPNLARLSNINSFYTSK